MPNKANLRLWVAALRSRVYEQGKEKMRQVQDGKVKHCCLGVAQEVALRAGHLPAMEINWGSSSILERSIHEEFYGLLSFKDGGTFGVRLETGSVLDGTPTSAAILNDEHGWSFDQIADAVEKTFDLLTYDEIFDPEFVPKNETVAT